MKLLPPSATLALAAVLLGACRGAPAKGEVQDPGSLLARGLKPNPFPAAFRRPAVLVAERIAVEGPADLLEHVAVLADPDHFEPQTRTTSEGLLQVYRRRPRARGVEVRCQLDNWQLAALRELRILQRPGEVPVAIVAEGEAAWIPVDGGPERREPRLEFRYGR